VENGSSEGVATAADQNCFSQPPALVNGHTESPNPTSVGGSNDGTSPTALDDTKVKVQGAEDALAPMSRLEGKREQNGKSTPLLYSHLRPIRPRIHPAPPTIVMLATGKNIPCWTPRNRRECSWKEMLAPMTKAERGDKGTRRSTQNQEREAGRYCGEA
jgi:hypothetical protein